MKKISSKKLLLPIIILIAAAVITGYYVFGYTPSSKVIINFPTAATTGTLYPLGSAMATLWNEQIETVNVTAQASGGGVDNLGLLRDGEAQVSMAVTSIAYESYNSIGTFDGCGNEGLRIIAGLYDNPNQIVVTEASGILTLEDLAGSRFAPGAPGSTTLTETERHLTAAGLVYPDSFNAQYVSFNEAIDLMRNRQLDGAWIMAGVPTAAVTEMLSTCGGTLIDVPDDVLASLQAEYPWYVGYTIPAGTYDGQNTDVQTTAVRMVLMSSESVDEETVYQLTKAFWENIDTLRASFPSLEGCTPQKAVEGLAGIPLHNGAQRYYQEIGVL